MDFRRKMFESVAPKSAALMRDLERVMDDPNTDPKLQADLQSLNTAFKTKMNLKTATELEHAIATDPAFAARLREGILKNPGAIERVLPNVIANPQSLKATVTNALPAATLVAGAPQVAPANGPAAYPGKGRRDAKTDVPPAALPAATVSAPTQESELADKLDQILAAKDFDKFVKTLEVTSPEAVNLVLQQSNNQTSDPEKRRMLIEGLHARVQKDPDFFSKMDHAISMNKGAASTVIRTLVSDPARGFAEMDRNMQMANGMTMFQSFFKPGGMDNLFARFKEILGSIMEMVTGLFRGSSRFALDNPNSRVAREALVAVNSSAVLEDVKTGESLPATAADADRRMEEDARQRYLREEEQRRQAAAPGGRQGGPGMDLQGA